MEVRAATAEEVEARLREPWLDAHERIALRSRPAIVATSYVELAGIGQRSQLGMVGPVPVDEGEPERQVLSLFGELTDVAEVLNALQGPDQPDRWDVLTAPRRLDVPADVRVLLDRP